MGDDNVLNTPGLMDPSTEFGSMMQHAMKIKGAQMEQDRKKFETWPLFLQNSMWERNEETLALRELPVTERLVGVAKLKEQGNEAFRNKHYTTAIELYEAAVGAFRYAKQLDPDWKKKGIKDETIDLIDERGEGETRDEVDSLLVSCYSNLAASYLGRAASGKPEPGSTIEADYKLCVSASTFGIEISPSCKALYRRARALSEPMTASDDDLDAAIRDLSDAAAREPDDKAVRTLLSKLKKTRHEAKAKESAAFAGVFGKGELYDAKSLDAMAKREASERKMHEPKDSKNRTPEDVEREIKEAEAAVAHLRANGRHEDAKELEKKIQAHRTQLEEFKKQAAEQEAHAKRHDPRLIDFSNPTTEQISDAKKHGIDLFDPMVVKVLARMRAHAGRMRVHAGRIEGGDVPAAYRGKMHQRLQKMKQRDAGDAGGRRRGAYGGDADFKAELEGGSSIKPNTKYFIMAVAFAIGLYRIWAVLGPGLSQGAAHEADDGWSDEGM